MREKNRENNGQWPEKFFVTIEQSAILNEDFPIEVEIGQCLIDVFDSIADATASAATKIITPKKKAALLRDYCTAKGARKGTKFPNMVLNAVKVERVKRKRNSLKKGRDRLTRYEGNLKVDLRNEHELVIGQWSAKHFYKSPEWRQARYEALRKYGNKCLLCGCGPNDGAVIHVDHIKPRSLYPEIALRIHNLQILCEDCNDGKYLYYEDDWRSK